MALESSSAHFTSRELESLPNINTELDCLTDSRDNSSVIALTDGIPSTSIAKTEIKKKLTLCNNSENMNGQSESPILETALKTNPNNVIKVNNKDTIDSAILKTVKTEKMVVTDISEINNNPNSVYLLSTTSPINNVTTNSVSSSGQTETVMSTNALTAVNAGTVATLIPSQCSSKTDKKTVQAIVKRPTMNPSGQVITKVIIASNTLGGQSSTQQLCLAPLQSVNTLGNNTTATTTSALGQSVKIIAAQPQTILSPTKTINLNQATLLASPSKTPILTTIPGTPSKQGIVVSKIAISPSKTPTKIMIPVSVAKSPQRIAPAPVATTNTITFVTNSTAANNGNKIIPVTVASPSKVIFRQAIPVTGPVKTGTALIGQPPVTTPVASTTTTTATTIKQFAVPISNTANVQPIQVPGSKFHYVRLVTSVGNSTGTKTAVVPVTTTKPIAPAGIPTSIQPQQQPAQVKIAVPIAPAGQPSVLTKPAVTQQRILIPTSSVSNMGHIRTTSNVTVPTNTLTPLPLGTALISTGGNMPGFVMVPAQYVTQQQFNQQGNAAVQVSPSTVNNGTINAQQQPILPAQATAQTNFVPIAAATTTSSSAPYESSQSPQLSRPQINGRASVEPNGVRPRKPCNCTKSQCLKLYCDCFANGEFCNNCNCNNCFNNLEHEEERQKAIKACLDRNPLAFHPKIGKGKDGEHERRHNKGCNCKRSGCLKNYCECYEAKIMCSNMCKCVGCKNFEESAERKTLMHLADAAEVRVQQQTAAKNKFSSQVQDVPSKPLSGTVPGERLPFSFVTPDVVQATCQCLLAQAEEGEKRGLSESALERLVLEEFGRCLNLIIKYANRTKTKSLGIDNSVPSGMIRSGRTGAIS